MLLKPYAELYPLKQKKLSRVTPTHHRLTNSWRMRRFTQGNRKIAALTCYMNRGAMMRTL